MKKLFSLLLAFSMLVACIPSFGLCAQAQDYTGTCGTKVKWILNTDSGVLNIYTANDKAMNEFSTETRPGWYDYRDYIRVVTISLKAKNIGSYAFADCKNLTKVYVPSTVKTVGANAFENCSSLTQVVYSDSQAAFDNIVVNENNDPFFTADKTFYSGTCGDSIDWSYSSGMLDIIGHGSMFDFGLFDPSWKSLAAEVNQVNIGNGVTSIINYAFSEMRSLTTAYLPSTVKNIGECAFESTALSKIYLPSSLVAVGSNAFYNSSSASLSVYYGGTEEMWSSVSVEDSGNTLLSQAQINYCCGKCGNKAYWELNTAGGELKITGEGTMYDYATYDQAPWYKIGSLLNYINIGTDITSIGDYSFSDCNNLISVSLSRTVSSVADNAFGSLASLREYTVVTGNESLVDNRGALISVADGSLIRYPQGKSDTQYDIPDYVTSIKDRAFYGNTTLRTVTVPIGLVTIGNDVFDGCTSLTDINFAGCIGLWNKINIGEHNDRLNALQPNCVDHVYDSGTVTTRPTCTKKGVRTYSCTICSETKAEPIKKTAHSYSTVVKTTAKVSREGKLTEECAVCGDIRATKTIAKIASLKLSTTTYTYNGKVKRPAVTVKDSKGNVISSKYYTLTYASGRKNVGKYKVTVKFKDRYTGTKYLYFRILPKATSISGISARKDGFNVKWNKVTAQTSGYQVQYSTSSKFTSPKTYKISNNATTSKRVTGLKSGKKYYVRVRTYKTVDGKKYFSSWSKYRTVIAK